MNADEKKANIRQMVIYLLITFIFTYAVEIFVIMPMAGSTDVTAAYTAQALISSVMFIPATGALLTILFTKDRLTGNLRISLNLRGNLKYYALVWPGFALLIFLPSGR